MNLKQLNEAYGRKWKPSKSASREFAQKMNDIDEFCRKNGIQQSKSSDSYYFVIDGKEYRVSNHSIEASNKGAYDEFGNQIRDKYHQDERKDDVTYIHAGKTRIMDIYNDLKNGYKLDGRGNRLREDTKEKYIRESQLQDLEDAERFFRKYHGEEAYKALYDYTDLTGYDLNNLLYSPSYWAGFEKYCKKHKIKLRESDWKNKFKNKCNRQKVQSISEERDFKGLSFMLDEAKYVEPKFRSGDVVFIGDAEGYHGRFLIQGDIKNIPEELYPFIRRIYKYGDDSLPTYKQMYEVEYKLNSNSNFEDDYKKFFDEVRSILNNNNIKLIENYNLNRIDKSLKESKGNEDLIYNWLENKYGTTDWKNKFKSYIDKLKNSGYNTAELDKDIKSATKRFSKNSKGQVKSSVIINALNEQLNETFGRKAVDKLSVINDCESFAKDLPQDKFSIETRRKYIIEIYNSYCQNLKPISHSGKDGKKYVYSNDDKNEYRLDTQFINATIQGNLASWHADEVRVDEVAPKEWRQKVNNYIKEKFTEVYSINKNKKLDEGFISVKDKVFTYIYDKVDNLLDNISIEVASKIPEYDPDWCVDDIYSKEYTNEEKQTYAFVNSIIDALFANFSNELTEDTVKKSNGKWTNKGDEGTHGELKTKKEADAQRKAMFANGFKEDILKESNNPLKDAAKKHRKKQKGMSSFCYLNPNAGDVEKGMDAFNNSTSCDGCDSLGEDFEDDDVSDYFSLYNTPDYVVDEVEEEKEEECCDDNYECCEDDEVSEYWEL